MFIKGMYRDHNNGGGQGNGNGNPQPKITPGLFLGEPIDSSSDDNKGQNGGGDPAKGSPIKDGNGDGGIEIKPGTDDGKGNPGDNGGEDGSGKDNSATTETSFVFKNGELFFKEDLNKKLEPTLDKDGNLIDEESGKIILTKDKVTLDADGDVILLTEIEDTIEDTQIATIQKAMGLTFNDENGKPIVYEDTIDGVTQYMNDVAEYKQQKFLEENRELLEYKIHLESGGTRENFYKENKNWSSYKLNETDTDKMEATVRAIYKEKGLSDVALDATIEALKKNQKIGEEYKSLVKIKQDEEKVAFENKQNQISLKRQEDIDKANKYWGEIYNTIKSGDLGVITIPDTEKDIFFKSLYNVGKNGLTPLQEKKQQDSLTAEGKKKLIALDYLYYKGLDVTSLVKKEVNNIKLKELKKQSKDSQDSSGGKSTKVVIRKRKEQPTISQNSIYS